MALLSLALAENLVECGGSTIMKVGRGSVDFYEARCVKGVGSIKRTAGSNIVGLLISEVGAFVTSGTTDSVTVKYLASSTGSIGQRTTLAQVGAGEWGERSNVGLHRILFCL